MKCVVLSAWCLMLGVAPSAVRADEEALPRNPFWPQGHEGTRYPISAEPRFKPEPEVEVPMPTTNDVEQVRKAESAAKAAAVEAERKRNDPLESPLWTNSVKALRFGPITSFSASGKARAVITINDRAYVVGDLVSETVDGHRFTWRIESISSDGKIKLKRITYRKIGTNP